MSALRTILAAFLASCGLLALAEGADSDEELLAAVQPYLRAACLSQDPHACVTVRRHSEGLAGDVGAAEFLFASRLHSTKGAKFYKGIACGALVGLIGLAMRPGKLVEYVEAGRPFPDTPFFVRTMTWRPFLFQTVWPFMAVPYNELELTPSLVRTRLAGLPAVMLIVLENSWLKHWQRLLDSAEECQTIFEQLAGSFNLDFYVLRSRELLMRLVLRRQAPVLARHCALYYRAERAEDSIRAQIADWWRGRLDSADPRPNASTYGTKVADWWRKSSGTGSGAYTLYVFLSESEQTTVGAGGGKQISCGLCVTVVDVRPSARARGHPLIAYGPADNQENGTNAQ